MRKIFQALAELRNSIAIGNRAIGCLAVALTVTTEGRPALTRASRDHPHLSPQPEACLSHISRLLTLRSIGPNGSGARLARFLRVGQESATFTSPKNGNGVSTRAGDECRSTDRILLSAGSYRSRLAVTADMTVIARIAGGGRAATASSVSTPGGHPADE